MSEHTRIVDNLRRHGHRVTPQRVIILAAMAEHGGHMTAEQIYGSVRVAHPYINRSTVYRTLDMLSKERIITATDLGGGCTHYELHRDEPHHHMVCQQCGKVDEVDHTLLEPLQNALMRKYKFKANIEHFAIFGLCTVCQQRKPKDAVRH